jgi:hypothetical protein
VHRIPLHLILSSPQSLYVQSSRGVFSDAILQQLDGVKRRHAELASMLSSGSIEARQLPRLSREFKHLESLQGPIGEYGALRAESADLLALAGRRVAGTTSGRPPLDPPAPLVVWDAVAIGPDDLAWLRMVAANRPGVGIVLLESFPRGDSNQAALRAGAGAVLGRPLTLEALEGTLRRLERLDRETRGLTGLGAAAPRR